MDVSRKPVLLTQKLQYLNQIVHDFDRASGNAGGDEEPLTPSALVGSQENTHQLFGLEQGAGHGPVSPHGTVVAVVAARVSHENAEQRHPGARQGTQMPDVQGTKRADILCVL